MLKTDLCAIYFNQDSTMIVMDENFGTERCLTVNGDINVIFIAVVVKCHCCLATSDLCL